ncbi:hypothetical protein KC686_04015, partial [Candidatus Woesebacteria bacterium]|nr:hypothetical protein [Candidatus Woesebacteria bacterium]
LGYPAGPVIEQCAKKGNKDALPFPLPMTSTKTFDLSFSGLKTSAKNTHKEITKNRPLTRQELYDFCASIQYAVFRHIIYKMSKILEQKKYSQVWLGGGVAANTKLRQMIRTELKKQNQKGQNQQPDISISIDVTAANQLKTSCKQPAKRLLVPYTKRLTMDNAAMIGIVAGCKLEQGEVVADTKNLERKPRWRLDEVYIGHAPLSHCKCS